MVSSGNFCRSGWVVASRLVSVVLFLFVVLPLMGLSLANTLLVTRQKPHKADAIVVLGGENTSRAEQSAALYKRGYATRILVTGKNEDKLIVKSLVAAGVPKEAVWVEPAATSTFENALFSVPILKQWKVKTVLLVTSCFHSRRATAVFRSNTGTIEFFSVPADNVPVAEVIKNRWLRERVLMEYVKIIGYWFKYGISPFNDFAVTSLRLPGNEIKCSL